MHPWMGDLDHDMSYQHDGSDGPDGNGDGDGDGTTTTTTMITTTMITMRGSSIISCELAIIPKAKKDKSIERHSIESVATPLPTTYLN